MNVMSRRTLVVAAFALGAFAVGGACNRAPSGPGQLSVHLVDAAPTDVDKIVVNVTKVTAHSSVDGWMTVTTTPFTVDLLTLRTTPLELGTISLSAGRITQIRLYVAQTGNWVHVIGDADDVQTPLFVPSGYQSGIKIHGPWEVAECERTTVTLDFDGPASLHVHPTGQGTQWILRPTIHAKHADTSPVTCEEPEGPSCSGEDPCPEGQICVEDVCVPDESGGSAGSECAVDDDCLSLDCPEGVCAPSPANGPCRTNDDCMNNQCSEGSCAPCQGDADCPAGFACTAGSCIESGNGM